MFLVNATAAFLLSRYGGSAEKDCQFVNHVIACYPNHAGWKVSTQQARALQEVGQPLLNSLQRWQCSFRCGECESRTIASLAQPYAEISTGLQTQNRTTANSSVVKK